MELSLKQQNQSRFELHSATILVNTYIAINDYDKTTGATDKADSGTKCSSGLWRCALWEEHIL
jgi:hypothetical protein